MAEIIMQAGNPRKPGIRRNKKLSTKVDLTPMVDLGFLLITFFILTTTWSTPRVTGLNMPGNGDSTSLGKDAALTILAGDNNKVFYYNGALEEALKNGNYGITGYSSSGGISDIIRQKQFAMDRSYKGGRNEMMLLIKPAEASSYKNVVNLLDETLINRVGKYAILDLTEDEKRLLRNKKL